ncbi:unnamed protein product [Oreochromis niloticus]|nr:unnamed protein product [Mustela putorius furo]
MMSRRCYSGVLLCKRSDVGINIVAKVSVCSYFSGVIRTLLEKMGLQGTVTPLQARKKWDNLKTKYKECKYPGSGEGVSGKPTAATWPWFALMDEVIGQRPSIRPPLSYCPLSLRTLQGQVQ